MTRTQKMDPVVRHVEQKEQVALQAIAYSQNQLETQKQRLQQLVEYRLDYVEQQQSGERIYSAVEMQEFQRFLSQLDQTFKQQQKLVELARREVEFKRENWLKTRIRSDALHKVVENMQQQQRSVENRLEQKAQDEFSQRLFHHKS